MNVSFFATLQAPSATVQRAVNANDFPQKLHVRLSPANGAGGSWLAPVCLPDVPSTRTRSPAASAELGHSSARSVTPSRAFTQNTHTSQDYSHRASFLLSLSVCSFIRETFLSPRPNDRLSARVLLEFNNSISGLPSSIVEPPAPLQINDGSQELEVT